MFVILSHPTIPDTLDMRCWGTWGIDTALAFDRAVADAIAALPCAPGRHLTLSDVREVGPHSEEVVRLLGGMLDRHGEGLGIAIIVGPGASDEQNRRITGGGGTAAFADRDSAEVWLRARSVDATLAA